VILTRRRPEETRTPPGCRAVRWDARTGEGWSGEVDGAAAIVNLAGESISGVRWTAAKKRRIVESRRGAAAAVVAAISAAARPPRVLVQASAVGYFGDRGDAILDEGSSPGEGFLAATAAGWERATEPAEALGVRRAVVRTGLVLAREGGALAVMARPFRFGLGAVLGSGEQWMPWIHLADEVAAIERLIDDETARGPFNLCAPEPATNASFSRSLARALRRPLFLRAPAFAVRLLLGEMADLVLTSARVTPRRLLDSGFRFRHADLDGALAELLRDR
jgi:uncharacterized protein (TIGR01777 family)